MKRVGIKTIPTSFESHLGYTFEKKVLAVPFARQLVHRKLIGALSQS